MRYKHWLYSLAWLPLVSPVFAGEPSVQSPTAIFRALQVTDATQARAQAQAWLEQTGQKDATTLAKFAALWNGKEALLDRVAGTFELGSPECARLLRTAADSDAAAPTELPALLTDAQQSSFFRANFALAYGRALTQRRVHEEALAVFQLVKAEQVVDPASYYFYRAVAEHGLALKDEALASIRNIDDVVDVPDRYQRVAQLMKHDIQSWGGSGLEQRLGHVARGMSNIQRRLDLARGGPRTQELQRRVVNELDELIKALEEEPHGPVGPVPPGPPEDDPKVPPDDHCKPPPTPGGGIKGSGPGHVDEKKLRQIAEEWGKLPRHKRAEAMAELTRGLPPRWAAILEKHARDLARGN